jgi:quercetin dioxygenase-like cupin family protein
MESARRYRLGTLPWGPIINGAEMAVLQGDPEMAGEYVIRFRTQREIFVPLHWHRNDEHIKVVSGPFRLSINNERSELAPGSSVVIPAGIHHCAWYAVGTMVQVSGMGPFESIYLDPVSDLGDRIKKPARQA